MKNSSISSESILYTSNRIYERKIQESWILFAPDSIGLPLLCSDMVYDILHFFEKGISVNSVYDLISSQYKSINKDEISAIVFNLHKAGLIKKLPTPKYYSAHYPIEHMQPNALSVWLHITNDCNLNCQYCFVDKTPIKMNLKTIHDVVKSIVSTVQLNGISEVRIRYAGGEPTLALNEIKMCHDQILHQLSRLNVTLIESIISNGTLVNNKLIQFLKDSKVQINISLDGYGTESHDIYRSFKINNKGTWSVIYKNVYKLIREGIYPYIAAILSGSTCESLRQLVSWIYQNQLKANFSVVLPMQARGLSFTEVENGYKEYINKIISSFEEAFLELENERYSINLKDNSFTICELSFQNPHRLISCGMGLHDISISHDGRVSRCPMLVSYAQESLNDDLFVSMKKLTQEFLMQRGKKKNHLNCLECQWFPVCAGGCPENNKRSCGDHFSVSPLHNFYEYVIPRYINFYAKKLLQEAKKQGIEKFHILEA